MYRNRIEKQKLNFASAHFITFENQCEALHGHNYYTMVELGGELDENHYIIDFKVVKKELQVLCDALDHKTLIAAKNPHLKIAAGAASVTVRYRNRKYVFPRADVVLLDIPNTTVEMLSEYLCRRLQQVLGKKGYLKRAGYLEVGVEESLGQMAVFRMNLPAAAASGKRTTRPL